MKTNEKGITLIALIVTVVVLLILMSISYKMVVGDNGLITRAHTAGDDAQRAEEDEKETRNVIDNQMTQYLTGSGKVNQVENPNPGSLEEDDGNTIKIMCIEDLVALAKNVQSGNTYEGKNIKLKNNLDFKSDLSYVNPNTTAYDLFLNGASTGLKQNLTSGKGFVGIGSVDHPFKGNFCGEGNALLNLYMNITLDANNKIAGLFGYVEGDISQLAVSGKINVNATNVDDASLEYYAGLIGKSTGKIDQVINKVNYIGLANGTSMYAVVVAGVCGYAKGDMNYCTNLGTIDLNIERQSTYAGGIAGLAQDNKISNCSNKADLTATGMKLQANVGGISAVAVGTTGIFENCTNYGSITEEGDTYYGLLAGGIAGENTALNTLNCKNYGNITVKNNMYEVTDTNYQKTCYAGGISGITNSGIDSKQNITSCFNSGNITVHSGPGNGATRTYNGGIIGMTNPFFVIENCYNTGNLYTEGTDVNSYLRDYLGGITGNLSNSKVNNCLNSGSVTVDAKGTKRAVYLASLVGGINYYTWTDDYKNFKSDIKNSINTGKVTFRNGGYGSIAELVAGDDFTKFTYSNLIEDSKARSGWYLMFKTEGTSKRENLVPDKIIQYLNTNKQSTWASWKNNNGVIELDI